MWFDIRVIMRREIHGFFTTPLMALLLWAYLVLAMALPLYFGGFFDRDQADMQSFFNFMPWILLVLCPAIGMRAWADDYKTGMIEIIHTMPISLPRWMIGKFFGAWAILTIIILATWPMAAMVGYLGNPDFGPICAGYLAVILLAGLFLASSQFASSIASNHVIAFVIGVLLCFVLLMAGSPLLAGILGGIGGWHFISDFLLRLSVQNYYDLMVAGDIGIVGVMTLMALIILFQFCTVLQLRRRQGA